MLDETDYGWMEASRIAVQLGKFICDDPLIGRAACL